VFAEGGDMNRFLAPIILAGAVLVGACATAPPPDVIYVPGAPPPVQVEVMGTAPGPDFIWIHGYHRWNGNGYVWQSGRWERRPHAKAVWVDGKWNHTSKGWYWRDGHWK
jgi:YXWGXW repeat-containing protein